ncbi:hypothetical protein KC19_5G016300 [Ceratodon purpureus]|uniref:Uncharacterized protein n=1 Tax=Ceratodon purpureus TaxID=3225 RepID=A0A8T0HZ45_CERPU|nr:hypothetical protein KC19_5G016300 [Ceratodon purpureus]
MVWTLTIHPRGETRMARIKEHAQFPAPNQKTKVPVAHFLVPNSVLLFVFGPMRFTTRCLVPCTRGRDTHA